MSNFLSLSSISVRQEIRSSMSRTVVLGLLWSEAAVSPQYATRTVRLLSGAGGVTW
jgi:hypothetical protein